MKHITAFILSSLLCALPVTFAAEHAGSAKVTFPNFPAGQHISGPKITANDLKGKVVFFEYWGINCPPCVAGMPHLQELYEKYRSKGFIVIGAHSQLPGPQVKQFLDDKKITFPVYQFISLPEAQCAGGLPFGVLIGANGKIVAKGYPDGLHKLIPKELEKVSKGVPILEDVELNKYKNLGKVIVANGSNIEAKIAPLRNKTDDDEARAICEAYDAWLATTKGRINTMLESDPLSAVNTIVQLKTAVPSVKEFDEKLNEFKTDKELVALFSLNKKITALEEKSAQGRKVTEFEVKGLQKNLDKFANSNNPATQTAIARLKDTLAGLEQAVQEQEKAKGKKLAKK